MRLTSRAFDDGARIPRRHTCEGDDLSPPLRFEGIPAGTESLAVIVDDPDAPGGTFVHWLLWNVPARVIDLPEGLAPHGEIAGLAPAQQGENGFGAVGWRGPCPPPGKDHRYRFRAYALGSMLSLSSGVDRSRLEERMRGRVLAEAELTGRYGRE